MTKEFNGWEQGVVYYVPVLVLGVVLSLAWWYFGRNLAGPAVFRAGLVFGALVVLLGLGMMLFFRDFPRAITAGENELACPADGTVVAIEDLPETPHYAGPCRRVSIFMSIFNAHVNRAPYPATVMAVKYAPGKFADARDPECSRINESNAVWLETDRGPITVRQISGAVARHIVCAAQPGIRLNKGEKYGMIRFGSRVEIYLPQTAEVYVKLNDSVFAGSTILGRFP